MADNVPITAGAGTVIATDDVAGVHYQVVKQAHGTDGVATLVSATNPLPSGDYLWNGSGWVPGTGDATNGRDVDVTRLGLAMLVSGSAGALNADCIAATDCLGYRYACVQITGTWVGTLTIQGSNDNVNFVSIQAQNPATANGTSSATHTANGIYIFPVAFRYLRVRMTAWTSGTAVATAVIDLVPAPAMNVGGMVALVASQTVGLLTGSNTVGAVQLTPAAAHGASSHHHRIAQATNVVNVKTSAGTINSLTISNLHATNPLYFKLYNSASAPTLGAGTPIEVFRIPATQTLVINCGGYGIRCTTGIAYALTSDLADTGVTNVAANDALVAMSYT